MCVGVCVCVCVCTCVTMQHLGRFSYSGLFIQRVHVHCICDNLYTSIEVGSQSTILLNIEKFTSMILKPAGIHIQ